jgi:anti-anti-sigma factor
MIIEIQRQDDVCVLRLQGRFVTGTDPEYLQSKAAEIKSCGCSKVLVDFREVSAIGSTGIGFVVGIYTSITKNANGRFVLVGPSPRVCQVLDLMRLSAVIPLAADITSGEAALRGA